MNRLLKFVSITIIAWVVCYIIFTFITNEGLYADWWRIPAFLTVVFSGGFITYTLYEEIDKRF